MLGWGFSKWLTTLGWTRHLTNVISICQHLKHSEYSAKASSVTLLHAFDVICHLKLMLQGGLHTLCGHAAYQGSLTAAMSPTQSIYNQGQDNKFGLRQGL